MLALYRMENGRVVAAEEGNAQIFFYYQLHSQEDYLPLIQNFKIDAHMVRSTLDAEEIARIDVTEQFKALICKRPHKSEECEHCDTRTRFRTSSLGLFFFKDQLVVVYDEHIPVEDFQSTNTPLQNIQDVGLNLVYHSTLHFFEEFHKIQNRIQNLEKSLIGSTTDRQLLGLFNLEKSMIHYLNSLGSNNALLERLLHDTESFGFTKKQIQFLKGMLIDSKQCYKQAEVASEIMASLTDASASLVNNKLSLMMKRLTVISLIFLPINAIAGIGGMSEFTAASEKLGLSMSSAYGFLSFAMIGVAYFTWYFIRKIDH